jgi:hypothetical protein
MEKYDAEKNRLRAIVPLPKKLEPLDHVPRWYNLLQHTFGPLPCHALGCKERHHRLSTDLLMSMILSFLIGHLTSLLGFLPPDVPFFWVHLGLLTVAYLPAGLYYKSLCDWRTHRDQIPRLLLKERMRVLPEAVYEHLCARIRQEREVLLGKASPLAMLDKSLRQRIREASALAAKVAQRAVDRRGEDGADNLKEATRRVLACVDRLKDSQNRLEEYRLFLQELFSACEHQAERAAKRIEDWLLEREVAALEQETNRSEEGLELLLTTAPHEVETALGNIQTTFLAPLTRAAQTLFTSSENGKIEQDMVALERLLDLSLLQLPPHGDTSP